MSAVGIGEVDVFDEGHLFEDIFGFDQLVQPAIDYGEGEGIAMLEHDDRGYHEQFIDLADDVRQLGAGVVAIL